MTWQLFRLIRQFLALRKNTESESDIDLSFVSDTSLRTLTADYYRQAMTCYQAGAYLGTLVACGGALEGLLAWALIPKREEAAQRYQELFPRKRKEKEIERWDLSELIPVATGVEILGETATDASWAVKEFRNFIHPYNLLRSGKSARADEALALNSLTAVREITRSLRNRLGTSSLGEGHGVD